MSRINEVAQKGNQRIRYFLFVLLSLLAGGIAGPKLVAMGGEIPMGFAFIASGLVFSFRAGGRDGFSRRGHQFWFRSALLGISSGAINVAFAQALARVPAGTLAAIMGFPSIAISVMAGLNTNTGRRRRLTLIPPLLVLAGYGVFLAAPGGGLPDVTGLVWAFAAAGSLGAYLVLLPKMAKESLDEKETLAAATAANLISGCLLLGVGSHGTLPLPGGAWSDSVGLAWIAMWGLLWMYAPTFLNLRAAHALPESVFVALQPLSSPVGLVAQLTVMGQPVSVWALIANIPICIGGGAAAILGKAVMTAQPAKPI